MNVPIVKTVAQGTALTSFTTILIKLIGLVSVFLILSRLSAAQYGVVELSLSLTSLLGIFMLPGISSLVLADVGAEKGRGNLSSARAILYSSLTLQLSLGVVAWAAVFFGADVFVRLYHLSSYDIRIVSFLFLLSPLTTTIGTLFLLHLRFFEQSLMNVLSEAAKLILLFVLLLYVHLTVEGVLYAVLFSQLLTVLVLGPRSLRLFSMLHDGAATPRVPWSRFLWGRGMWSTLSTYTGNVGSAARLWIIRRVLGEEAVGLYAVAAGLMSHTTALVPLPSVLTPLLPQYAHDKERFVRLVRKGIEYQFLAYLVLGAGAFIFFPPIFGWIFPKYVGAFPLFRLMLLGLIPGAVIAIVTPAFSALKLQKSFFMSMLFKTASTIVFAFIGVTYFGLYGLAFESVLTGTLQAIGRVRSLRKYLGGVRLFRSDFLSFDDEDRVVIGSVRQALVRVLRPGAGRTHQ
ncbi:MAG: oligosaccharide flippase family protein [Patescibacteria group bacterium]|nr:oligosaccharide flippase family protein [Patescibacteria group bacterium]